MEPELIADYKCVTGESPLWHPIEKKLYWLDISRGRMFHFDPATGEHAMCYEGEPVGGFTVQADGALLLFTARGAVATWRDGKLNYIIEEIPEERESRFNDVIADPVGRVFCGTMPTKERLGRLYRLDTDGSITLLLEGIGCSNGMGFTPDRKQMYYVDSPVLTVYLFDYDWKTGAISNRRVFMKTSGDDGAPDGMTVDAEGYVWVAVAGSWSIVRYTPQGVEERRIRFPARKVYSLTFGGEDYTDIYVTTAGGDNKAEEGPGAGALFRVRADVRGVPEFFSRVAL